MDHESSEAYFGNEFVETNRFKRYTNKAMAWLAGISIASGTANYFLAPTERLTNTGIPYAIGVVSLGTILASNKILGHIEDHYLAAGIRRFDESGPADS